MNSPALLSWLSASCTRDHRDRDVRTSGVSLPSHHAVPMADWAGSMAHDYWHQSISGLIRHQNHGEGPLKHRLLGSTLKRDSAGRGGPENLHFWHFPGKAALLVQGSHSENHGSVGHGLLPNQNGAGNTVCSYLPAALWWAAKKTSTNPGFQRLDLWHLANPRTLDTPKLLPLEPAITSPSPPPLTGLPWGECYGYYGYYGKCPTSVYTAQNPK